jgi:hypothetical protein
MCGAKKDSCFDVDDAPSPLVASAQIMTNKLLPAFPNPASMRRE